MSTLRPTKKQKELLEFIAEFITEHGYSPSYREIMVAKGYSSVATVAAHISNLIKRGHLVKRDNSARSLELTGTSVSTAGSENGKEWLISRIESHFAANDAKQDDLYVLLGALKVLGLHTEFDAYRKKLMKDKK